MTAPHVRILFAIGERLHMSVAAVERLSTREIQGWIDYFTPRPEPAPAVVPDGSIALSAMSKAARRAAFNHGAKR